MKATGEIYFSPFIQASSSVSSGYKDNTLVFDGVDDSLTIPELELDETAMSVIHDGKIYSYEDDKVLTVGEDGEVIGGGKNLIPNFKSVEWSLRGEFELEGSSKLTIVNDNSFSDIKIPVEAGREYAISFKQNGRYKIYHYDSDGGIVGSRVDIYEPSTTFIPPVGTIETKINLHGELDSAVHFEKLMLVKNDIASPYSPAPEDYKTTSLSPSSLSNLQLYNRPLRKDEILHNSESKGLKELVDGVVVQDGLVLHYDFSHESNISEYKGKAFDYSGNGNHGVLNNFNFTEESGYDGNKLKFDGIDDYITTQGFANHLPTLKDFTIQLAYKRNTYVDTTVVFGNRTGVFEGAGGNGIELRSNANGYSFYIDDGVSYRNNLVPYQNEQTDLITLVRENGNVSTYFGGDFEKVLDLSEVGDISSGREMFLGSRPNNSYQDDGELFSFKIYNRPLTPEEIAHNYQIEKEKIPTATSLPVGQGKISETFKVGGDI